MLSWNLYSCSVTAEVKGSGPASCPGCSGQKPYISYYLWPHCREFIFEICNVRYDNSSILFMIYQLRKFSNVNKIASCHPQKNRPSSFTYLYARYSFSKVRGCFSRQCTCLRQFHIRLIDALWCNLSFSDQTFFRNVLFSKNTVLLSLICSNC